VKPVRALEVGVASVLAALPKGGSLPTQSWRARHHAVLILLWAHAVLLPALGIAWGFGVLHSVAEGSIVGILAAAATVVGSRRAQTSLATIGLLSASAILVHLSGGVIEMHFHFFVMMAVITMYHDWVPFLLAIGYVVLHHGVVGALDPTAVFNHPDAWREPWKWATIHGAFIMGASAAGVIQWRMHERAQHEILRVQRHFRDAFDNAPIGMALVALDGRWLEVNRSVCEITGYSSDELLSRTFQDITHPDDLDEDLTLVRRLLDGEIDSYQMEKRYLHASGHDVPILLSVTLVKGPTRNPEYFIAQIQDMTERKRAEEYYRRLYKGQSALVSELEEAHRLKSELFNIVSHEFKTPLAGIIGFAGLLLRKGEQLEAADGERYLQTITRQAERLNRLVENLFISAHQIEPAGRAVASIAEALEAVKSQLADTYEDVSLDSAIAAGLRPKMSQEALRLVLLNLVSNAVKHASANSTVRIVGSRADHEVAIAVSNVGEPIPPEKLARIFDPFVQGDTPARTAEGVGLGLHIVDKLVRAHQGRVDVDCRDGEVSFTVYLPQSESPAEASDSPRLDLTDAGRVA
jgi:PAS domain S-box-containing protein